MYLGKIVYPQGTTQPFSPASSSPKMGSNDPTNLDEVVVTVKPHAQLEEDLPEIVVQGTRIPWYVWLLLGGVAVAILTARVK